MIYCARHRESYREGLVHAAEGGTPLKKLGKCDLGGDQGKYGGGSVWKTKQEALQYLIKRDYTGFDVFGIAADWTDTESLPGEEFNRLLIDAHIVAIGYPMKEYLDGY